MQSEDLWVFAYGSLLWNPGFESIGQCKAVLPGLKRSFCMKSMHYRGTPEKPGLVLALDHDDNSVCEGVLYHVSPERRTATLEYLRKRELISYAYKEEWHLVEPVSGDPVLAVTYVIDRNHFQYTSLDLTRQASIIAHAGGPRGSNIDYLVNTMRSLRDLEIVDNELETLSAMVERLI